ncbi:MAG: DUF413 domain-containing protein [Arsenophonus sp.]
MIIKIIIEVFSRYGDFTIKEAKLLEYFSQDFNELDLGKYQLQIKEEKLFVSMYLNGEQKPANNRRKV